MTEILYYPLIDCDTEGTEKVALLPTPNGSTVGENHKLWLEEMVPHYFRLHARNGCRPASSFSIRCPLCGKSLKRISADIDKTKLGLYVCSPCAKK